MGKQPQFPQDERDRKDLENLIGRIQRHLPLEKWGFRLSYVSRDSIKVVFDSEWCRFKVSLYGGRYPQASEEELTIYYGRLHAPDIDPFMIWNGEVCHCWHASSPLIFFFLERYSPEDAVNYFWVNVPGISQYWQSEKGTQLRETYPAEFGFSIEALAWQRYGKSLFELFDLRRPDLWQQYRVFLREFYKLKNWQSRPRGPKEVLPNPPPWMIY